MLAAPAAGTGRTVEPAADVPPVPRPGRGAPPAEVVAAVVGPWLNGPVPAIAELAAASIAALVAERELLPASGVIETAGAVRGAPRRPRSGHSPPRTRSRAPRPPRRAASPRSGRPEWSGHRPGPRSARRRDRRDGAAGRSPARTRSRAPRPPRRAAPPRSGRPVWPGHRGPVVCGTEAPDRDRRRRGRVAPGPELAAPAAAGGRQALSRGRRGRRPGRLTGRLRIGDVRRAKPERGGGPAHLARRIRRARGRWGRPATPSDPIECPASPSVLEPPPPWPERTVPVGSEVCGHEPGMVGSVIGLPAAGPSPAPGSRRSDSQGGHRPPMASRRPGPGRSHP